MSLTDSSQTIASMALLLFGIANPVGNVPVFVSLVKDFEFRYQRWILFREALISLLLVYAYLFLGKPFLNAILIEDYSVPICGGVLVFLISLQMIFPPAPPHGEQKGPKMTKEPFVVPIATPLISGGGVLATTLCLAREAPTADVALAIAIAWVPVFITLVASAYLQKILGKRGLIAMEQLMGMLLLMLSIELLTKGLAGFGYQTRIFL